MKTFILFIAVLLAGCTTMGSLPQKGGVPLDIIPDTRD
jgi:hypothetical protein